MISECNWNIWLSIVIKIPQLIGSIGLTAKILLVKLMFESNLKSTVNQL